MKCKFAITGAECSGKSTLANALGEDLLVKPIPEFAIEYLDDLGREYTQEDLYHIAVGQMVRWNACEDDILIADTEILVIMVWSKVVFGSIDERLYVLFNAFKFNHYFLCEPDIPWEAGPHRVNPNDRDELFEIYLNLLTELNVSFTRVHGDYQERIAIAKQVIAKYLVAE